MCKGSECMNGEVAFENDNFHFQIVFSTLHFDFLHSLRFHTHHTYFALILLPFASCVSSAKPSASINGGIYIPNLPRNPFFSPYHPPTGFLEERPQASTVPSFAGFCSSALPRSIQSPCFLSLSLIHI